MPAGSPGKEQFRRLISEFRNLHILAALGPLFDFRSEVVANDEFGVRGGLDETTKDHYVEHLLACGRRRIAHVSGDPGYKAAQDRATGARAALVAAGLELVGGQTYFGSWSEGWGRGAARMVVEQHPDVDGFFCGSDQIARGVLDALRELGRDVPGDVSVIGFDNWEVLSTNARPQLSSVDTNLERVGRVAAQRLFAAIDGTVRPGIEELPCRVVTRASSAPIN